jgi:hypothetical protein
MDDLVYGRKPPPKELQPWLRDLEVSGSSARRG